MYFTYPSYSHCSFFAYIWLSNSCLLYSNQIILMHLQNNFYWCKFPECWLFEKVLISLLLKVNSIEWRIMEKCFVTVTFKFSTYYCPSCMMSREQSECCTLEVIQHTHLPGSFNTFLPLIFWNLEVSSLLY